MSEYALVSFEDKIQAMYKEVIQQEIFSKNDKKFFTQEIKWLEEEISKMKAPQPRENIPVKSSETWKEWCKKSCKT